MRDSSIQQAESCILQLQSSINDTSKNIQKSKEMIYSLQQSYNSIRQHHNPQSKTLDSQSILININMNVQDEELNKIEDKPVINQLKVNGERFIKEKEFGKIVKVEEKEKEKEKGREYNNQKQNLLREKSLKESKFIDHILETNDKDINQLNLSYESYGRIGSEKQIYRVLIQKYQKPEGVTRNYNSVTVQTSPVQFVYKKYESSNYATPIKIIDQINPQSTQALYHRMSQNRSKTRKPIFQKRHSLSQKMDLQNYEQRFKSIKEKLRMAESLIETNIEAKKQRQKSKQKANKVNFKQIKSKMGKNSKVNTQPNTSLSKNKNFSGSKKINHNKSRLQTSTGCRNHHHISSHYKSDAKQSPSPKKKSTKSRMIDQFSKSQYYIRNNGPIQCDKYKRQIEKITRERYLSEAMKTPGIDKYYTYSELYHFYIHFRKMDLPEYRWVEFLQGKIREIHHEMQTQYNRTAR